MKESFPKLTWLNRIFWSNTFEVGKTCLDGKIAFKRKFIRFPSRVGCRSFSATNSMRLSVLLDYAQYSRIFWNGLLGNKINDQFWLPNIAAKMIIPPIAHATILHDWLHVEAFLRQLFFERPAARPSLVYLQTFLRHARNFNGLTHDLLSVKMTARFRWHYTDIVIRTNSPKVILKFICGNRFIRSSHTFSFGYLPFTWLNNCCYIKWLLLHHNQTAFNP